MRIQREAVRGLKATITNLKQYQERVRQETRRANVATGMQVGRIATRKIQAAGRGATYDTTFAMVDGKPRPMGPRSGQNLSATHTASAPGEPPATDTGALVRSLHVEAMAGDLSVRVGTNKAYGRYLEHGTPLVAPRPWLMPSLREARPDHIRRLQEIHNRAAR